MQTRSAAVIGVCMVLAAVAFGIFFYQSRADDTTIRVVGNATKNFEADMVKWTVTIVRNVDGLNPRAGYGDLANDVQVLVDRVAEQGIDREDILVQPVNTNQIRNHQNGTIMGYRIVQTVMVVSDEVDALESVAVNPGEIMETGVIIENSRLEYFFSKVDELKWELLAAAAADARKRAQEIASSTDVDVGPLKSARMGVFQITEPYSTEVSAYGIHNTSTRDKDIRVTVHAEFGVK